MSPRARPLVLIALGVLVAGLLAVAARIGDDGGPAGPLRSDRFDADRAWALIERQVAVGQRPAGSPQLRALAEELRPLLPGGRLEDVPGEPGLRNVVGVLPGSRPAILIGAHYDTLTEPEGFVGANNGAAGTAAVVEIARAMRRAARPPGAPEIRFVLFDGEEPAEGVPADYVDFASVGLRGSRAYAATHADDLGAVVILDYIAGRDLALPREGSSTPELWERLRDAGDRVGAGPVFPPRTGPTIQDDHTPFLRAGVPAVDLIDWAYPGHDLADGLALMSRENLDAVGESVVQLLLDLGGGPLPEDVGAPPG